MYKILIIYFTDKKAKGPYQIIKPMLVPEKGWGELAYAITDGVYHSFDVF